MHNWLLRCIKLKKKTERLTVVLVGKFKQLLQVQVLRGPGEFLYEKFITHLNTVIQNF